MALYGIYTTDKEPDFNRLLAICQRNLYGLRKTLKECDISAFVADIKKYYPNGFNFSRSAIRLVEHRTGETFSMRVQKAVKREMALWQNELWFFLSDILPEKDQEDLIVRANDFLEQYSFFSLTLVQDIFKRRHAHLPSQKVINGFIEVILFSVHKNNISFSGGCTTRICFRKNTDIQQLITNIVSTVHAKLQEHGDSVRISELHESFPNLNAKFFEHLCKTDLSNAIIDFIDDEEALKLICFYNLRDDFPNVIERIISQVENDNSSPSIRFFEIALNDYYQRDFREDYALTSDIAFMRVISYIYAQLNLNIPREWYKKNFYRVGQTNQPSVIDKFMQKVSGIFSEDEFLTFVRSTTFSKNKDDMLVHSYLCPNFIHINSTYWSSVSFFKHAVEWSTPLENRLTESLLHELGNAPFLPISKLSYLFEDTLPELKIDMKTIRWTHELIASVAHLCLPSIKIINLTATPYPTTALLVPQNANIEQGIVHYMLNAYQEMTPYLSSIDDVFDFLKTNHVRVNRTKHLCEIISNRLGIK